MPKYLITEEVGELLRAPVETVRYWRHIGKGPRSFKVGRRVLYAADDVEAFVREARSGGDGEPPGGPGGAAPGTQQHPAERRHRQRGSGPATPEAPPLSAEVSALGGATTR